MPDRYRKKPVVIEAAQFNGDNADELLAWMSNGARTEIAMNGALTIRTLEGDLTASPGDWIIRGVQGEFYPCKPDIFESTYDPA